MISDTTLQKNFRTSITGLAVHCLLRNENIPVPSDNNVNSKSEYIVYHYYFWDNIASNKSSYRDRLNHTKLSSMKTSSQIKKNPTLVILM